MGATYKGITVTFGADTTQLGTALRKVDKQSKETNQSIREINKALKFDKNNMGLLSQKFGELSTQIDTTKRRLDILKNTEEQVEKQFKDGKIGEEQYQNFRRELQLTETRLSGLRNEARNTSETIRTNFTNAVNNLKSTISGATKVIAAAETALISFSAKAVSAGMDFDKAMSNVKAISGATAEEMETLRNKAQEMGSSTVYSASQAADALSYMALAGWDTKSMTEGISPVLNLAAASAMDLGTASDIVTDYLTAFGLKASDAANFVDIMAYAMSNSNTTTAQLGEAYKNCAATASSMGYSVEETTAVLMAMSNAGVKGGEAGTSLNSIMTRLATNTKDCATELGKYGVNIYDAQGNMQSLSSILQGMAEIWGDLTDKEQASLAKSIAGTNQYAALQTIMKGCSEAAKESGQSFSDYAMALSDCTGTAENMSKTMVDNLSGDITILKSAFEGLQIAISDKLTTPLRGAAKEGTKTIESLTSSVSDGKLAKAIETLGDSISRLITNGTKSIYDILPLIINSLVTILDHLDVILGVMTAIATTSAIKKVITNVTSLISAVWGLRTAIQSATTAQEVFNAAASANIIGAIAMIIGTAAGAFVTYKMSADDAADSTEAYSEAVKDAAKETKTLVDTISDSQKKREEATRSLKNEYNGYEALVDKLYELNDVENKTTAQKSEMQEIVKQLNAAIPELNLSIDAETDCLNKQKEAIDKIIQSKKDLAIVNLASEQYAALEIEKSESQKQYESLSEKIKSIKRERESLESEYNALYQKISKENRDSTKAEDERFTTLESRINAIKKEEETLAESRNALYDKTRELNKEQSDLNDIISQHSESVNEVTTVTDEATTSNQLHANSLQDVKDAYDKAKSSIKTYISEISSLNDVLKDMDDNQEYSTEQVFNLIDKYPELASHIEKTKNGYIVEREAIEKLIEARAKNIEHIAKEQVFESKLNLMRATASGNVFKIAEAAKQYAEAKQYLDSVSDIVYDVKTGGVRSGYTPENKSSSKSSTTTKSNTTTKSSTQTAIVDSWKESAEKEIAKADHLYKMGKISASDYYKRLDEINSKYYKNKSK